MLLLLLLASLAAPSNFHATPTINTVTLTWSYSNSGFSNFQVDRMQSGPYVTIAMPDKQARSLVDTAIQPATTYTYRIKAVKGNQSSQYVFVTVTTDTPIPPTPMCPSALQVKGDFLIVILAWPQGGLTLVQATLDGMPYGPMYVPVPLEPFGNPITIGDPPVSGNFITVLDSTKLANGSCHMVGAFAIDTLNLTGTAVPIEVLVQN